MTPWHPLNLEFAWVGLVAQAAWLVMFILFWRATRAPKTTRPSASDSDVADGRTLGLVAHLAKTARPGASSCRDTAGKPGLVAQFAVRENPTVPPKHGTPANPDGENVPLPVDAHRRSGTTGRGRLHFARDTAGKLVLVRDDTEIPRPLGH